ncbi:hypothetical protein B4135_0408 [Caldibacillus debilis]|uniref:Uncharacterized protein n=1 Tax=Caldibacillus debilis TaxID=301148 RepID=A0A150L8T7_9BACI|nr:hypothetical protein B4135_0408 [Caldibacillus debilis]
MRIGGNGSAKTASLQKWLKIQEPVRLFPATKIPTPPDKAKFRRPAAKEAGRFLRNFLPK